jgi:hypothetical protein
VNKTTRPAPKVLGSKFCLAGLGDTTPGELVPEASNKWFPIRLQFIAKDSQQTKHQILLIVMPSGVATTNLSGISMEVDDEGWSFHLKIKVPKLATDVEKLYQLIERHWEETKPNYIPCLDGFRIHDALEDHLANLRKKETESLISEAVFPLEIHVSKKIHEIQILGDKGQNTRILYVDLKGEESEYKAVPVAKVTM